MDGCHHAARPGLSAAKVWPLRGRRRVRSSIISTSGMASLETLTASGIEGLVVKNGAAAAPTTVVLQGRTGSCWCRSTARTGSEDNPRTVLLRCLTGSPTSNVRTRLVSARRTACASILAKACPAHPCVSCTVTTTK